MIKTLTRSIRSAGATLAAIAFTAAGTDDADHDAPDTGS